MDFTEKTKKEVRKKAMSKCCFCQSLDIHVHHIVPGGSNDISNGVPLCPNCHEIFHLVQATLVRRSSYCRKILIQYTEAKEGIWPFKMTFRKYVGFTEKSK